MILRLLVMAAVLGWPAAASAQYGRDVRVGLQGSWADEADFGVGARLDIELDKVYSGLGVTASFYYYFPDDFGDVDASYWEANTNVTYMVFGDLGPYVGTGLNIAQGNVGLDPGDAIGEDATKVGLNLLGGLRFNDRLFLEARFELGGGDQFVATAGLLF
jgi:hypothetical protein